MITEELIPEKNSDVVVVFSPSNNSWILNYTEFNLFRVQIRKHALEGYYIVFKGLTYSIDKYGLLEWPFGLFARSDYAIFSMITRPEEIKEWKDCTPHEF